jgi:hypothetical protein
VEGFVPVIVGGDAQPGDSGGIVAHLGDLLFQGHAGDKVLDAFIEWEGRVEVFFHDQDYT